MTPQQAATECRAWANKVATQRKENNPKCSSKYDFLLGEEYGLRRAACLIEQIQLPDVASLINSIAGSIRGYPHLGGDITIMQALDELLKTKASLPESPTDFHTKQDCGECGREEVWVNYLGRCADCQEKAQ